MPALIVTVWPTIPVSGEMEGSAGTDRTGSVQSVGGARRSGPKAPVDGARL